MKATWRLLNQNTLSRNLDSLDNIVTNVGNTFQYRYNENTVSAYSLFKNTFKKFTYQAGLRAEYAKWVPELVNTNQTFKKEYLQLFPSLAVSYEIKKGRELIFNYGRRLNRPVSGDLNPFTVYSDPYNLRKGKLLTFKFLKNDTRNVSSKSKCITHGIIQLLRFSFTYREII